MPKKEIGLDWTGESAIRTVTDRETFDRLTKLKIPCRLVSQEELNQFGPQMSEEEIQQMKANAKKRKQAETRHPFNSSEPRETSDPEMFQRLTKLGIPCTLIPEDEL